jgi:hypothetical protein
MAKKRRPTGRRPRSKSKSRAVRPPRAHSSRASQSRARSARKRTARAAPKRPARKAPDLQEQVVRAFEQQVDSLLSRLADQCRQFAEGFNQAIGSTAALTVAADRNVLRVSYPQAETELVMELDREERYLDTAIYSDLADGAYHFRDPLSVGLTVSDDKLQFVLTGDIVSEEHVAVALLRRLTSGDSEPV